MTRPAGLDLSAASGLTWIRDAATPREPADAGQRPGSPLGRPIMEIQTHWGAASCRAFPACGRSVRSIKGTLAVGNGIGGHEGYRAWLVRHPDGTCRGTVTSVRSSSPAGLYALRGVRG